MVFSDGPPSGSYRAVAGRPRAWARSSWCRRRTGSPGSSSDTLSYRRSTSRGTPVGARCASGTGRPTAAASRRQRNSFSTRSGRADGGALTMCVLAAPPTGSESSPSRSRQTGSLSCDPARQSRSSSSSNISARSGIRGSMVTASSTSAHGSGSRRGAGRRTGRRERRPSPPWPGQSLSTSRPGRPPASPSAGPSGRRRVRSPGHSPAAPASRAKSLRSDTPRRWARCSRTSPPGSSPANQDVRVVDGPRGRLSDTGWAASLAR